MLTLATVCQPPKVLVVVPVAAANRRATLVIGMEV